MKPSISPEGQREGGGSLRIGQMLPLHLSQLLFPIFIFISDSDSTNKDNLQQTRSSLGKEKVEKVVTEDTVSGLCLAAWPQVSCKAAPLSTVFASGSFPPHNAKEKYSINRHLYTSS